MTKAHKTVVIPAHGGQLAQISSQFGIAESELLDFSANLNPNGPPPSVLRSLSIALTRPKVIRDYPDLEMLELRLALATYAGVGATNILVANGVVPLLEATLRAARVTKCLLLLPAFSEYRKTLTRCGIEIRPYLLEPRIGFRVDSAHVIEQATEQECDAILLANPQNPSGVIVDQEILVELVRHASECGIQVLLDEAFIDYEPTESLSTIAPTLSNLVVFRSLTKFFAMAGLRIAFAIVNSASAIEAREIIPSWPVSSLAIEAARVALEDGEYCNTSRRENESQRELMRSNLDDLKLRTFDSKANYLLLGLPLNCNSTTIWQQLIVAHGIVTRCCDNFEGLSGPHLRIAVKSGKDNPCVIHALASLLKRASGGCNTQSITYP